MTHRSKSSPGQISMLDIFAQAEQEAATAHLPATMAEALPYFRALIQRNHEAVLACDESAARRAHDEAHDLAIKLNGDTLMGILGGSDAPGCVLERETAAPRGSVPLYGQRGEFVIITCDIPIQISMDGIFGIGSGLTLLPNFSIKALDYTKPFPSETGYRSFIGYSIGLKPGTLPDEFARLVIEHYIADKKHGCNGKLMTITPEYAERYRRETPAP
jgi:hypothetical protein